MAQVLFSSNSKSTDIPALRNPKVFSPSRIAISTYICRSAICPSQNPGKVEDILVRAPRFGELARIPRSTHLPCLQTRYTLRKSDRSRVFSDPSLLYRLVHE